MWTIGTNSMEHAHATAAYINELNIGYAKAVWDDLCKYASVEVECDLKYRRQIAGFVDGLEWYGETHSIIE